MKIRVFESRDIDGVLAIQSVSPETANWTSWDYNRVAAGEMAGWIAEEQQQVVGFLVGRQVGSDLEILNFAVAPPARRRGVGSALLREAISWGSALFRAENVLLEVRASNQAALHFYQQHAFQATGRRARYSVGPVEVALVLTLRLA